jgi:hypothetical protein
MSADIFRCMIDDADAALRAEVTDAQWADFGRMVSENIYNPDFLSVLTSAGLKSKSTREMLGYIRTFILTGVRP